MLKHRIIPCLLVKDGSLVKTICFDKYSYIGDPANTLRIFNELEVDELVILDISAAKNKKDPDINLLKEVADECFMPLAYGGGIQTLEQAKNILSIGLEKVIINSHAVQNPTLITQLADSIGNQAVIVSIDVRKNANKQYEVWIQGGTKNTHKNPIEWAMEAEKMGAGEILITSIDNEGTWKGYDIQLIKTVCEAVNIPIIAHGGAGNITHLKQVVQQTKASAMAVGSMVVYQKKGFGVLVNFPTDNEIKSIFN